MHATMAAVLATVASTSPVVVIQLKIVIIVTTETYSFQQIEQQRKLEELSEITRLETLHLISVIQEQVVNGSV